MLGFMADCMKQDLSKTIYEIDKGIEGWMKAGKTVFTPPSSLFSLHSSNFYFSAQKNEILLQKLKN